MDVTYPSVTRTILQLFRCRELGTPSNSQLFLEADYARCDSAGHFSRLNALLFAAAGLDFHSRVLLCHSMTGSTLLRRHVEGLPDFGDPREHPLLLRDPVLLLVDRAAVQEKANA